MIGPISFLYRLMFRVELELLAARGTRSVRVSLGRRILRLLLVAISAALYWSLIWYLINVDGAWTVVGWTAAGAFFLLMAVGCYFGLREFRSDLRHRKALRELDGGWSNED